MKWARDFPGLHDKPADLVVPKLFLFSLLFCYDFLVMNTRRHDLDALRGFAMLLGIVLHASLSFIPDFPWLVKDEKQSSGLYLLFAAIHGFRMPLFFILSGFFASMMVQKKGLGFYARHRTKRILLPLVIFPIILGPLIDYQYATTFSKNAIAKNEKVNQDQGTGGKIDHDEIFSAETVSDLNLLVEAAIRTKDLEALKILVDRGASVNALNNIEIAPLHWATGFNDIEAILFLVESGADVNIRDGKESTPLLWATFFGKTEALQALLDLGADATLRNDDGASPIEVVGGDLKILSGLSITFAGLLAIPVDGANLEKSLKANKEILINEGGVAAQAGDGKYQGNLLERNLPSLHHLWFLWYLFLLITLYGFLAPLLKIIPQWSSLKLLVNSPLRYLWLIPTIWIFQSQWDSWSFGPATDVSWSPSFGILGYYGTFFFFGALSFSYEGGKHQVGRYWGITLPLALLVVFPLGLSGLGSGNEQGELVSFYIATYTCLMCFGLIGAFKRLFSTQSKWVRYLSDSSYWLYIAHLPLVYILQNEMKGLEMPAPLKLISICCIAFVVLLLSYRLFVRYTIIGQLLNGKRSRG